MELDLSSGNSATRNATASLWKPTKRAKPSNEFTKISSRTRKASFDGLLRRVTAVGIQSIKLKCFNYVLSHHEEILILPGHYQMLHWLTPCFENDMYMEVYYCSNLYCILVKRCPWMDMCSEVIDIKRVHREEQELNLKSSPVGIFNSKSFSNGWKTCLIFSASTALRDEGSHCTSFENE
ncbi:translation initiation factor 1A 1 [Striga asiatica]|uniref:Translation initiation factor 1A 1 n=1 Tax=Striga asiatica TaxID=4170 RepID=A0A5A7R7Z0_STRAF|nr:translation initiation factor 1A 1 [Striga asiatica]